MAFLGYPRPDGSVGIRNHVLVIPGGMVASKICDFVWGTRTIITADHGSGRTKRDRETIARTLVGLGRNPNTAAVIIHSAHPGAGYPELTPQTLAEQIAASRKPVEIVDAAKEGGTLPAIEKGITVARHMVHEASKLRREPFQDHHLTIGVKCGYSDNTSGLVGNPAIGYAFDKLVAAGGTALFGETTEVIGAENILARRAANEQVAKAFLEAVETVEAKAKASGQDIRTVNPVPANIAAGITTLEEKSLGAIYKAGTTPIRGVLKYAERPPGKGLYFVDSWMGVLSLLTGFTAAAAQLVIFQLGGGGVPGQTILEPAPTVVAPLLWATGNPVTYQRAAGSIDFYSGTVIEGKESLPEVGERLYSLILDIASGTLTKSETINFSPPAQVYTLDPVF